MFNNKIKYTILTFLTVLIILYIIKPSLLFNLDNTVKGFGVKSDQSIFTIYHISFIFAILVYISV